MKILLTTIGSGGDLFPFVAVGRELRRRGHDVVFAVPPVLKVALARERFVVHRIGPAQHHDVGRIPGFTDSRWYGARTSRAFWHGVAAPSLRRSAEDLDELVQESRPDLVLAHQYQLAAPIVARRHRIPLRTLHTTPSNLPSTWSLPVPVSSLLPSLPAPIRQVAARVGWRLWSRLLTAPAEKELRSVAASMEVELADLRPLTAGSSDLALACQHDVYAEVPPDLRGRLVNVGYPLWDAVREPREVAAIERLGDAGPLVVACFGTLVDRGRERLWTVLEQVLAEAGARGVFLNVPKRIWRPADDRRVLALDYTPLSGLIDRAEVLVHHGGLGVTSAALRAGRPSVVVPHAFDQFFHARRGVDLGIASAVPRSRLDAGRLGQALEVGLGPAARQRAADIGAVVRADPDPAGRVADLVTALPA